MLTFGFDTAVSLIAIELDLFLCPEWNIGAPYITLYADELENNDSSGLVFSYHSVQTGDLDFLRHSPPPGHHVILYQLSVLLLKSTLDIHPTSPGIL